MFAIKAFCKETRNAQGYLRAKAGQEVWLTYGFYGERGGVWSKMKPARLPNLAIFDTRDEAEKEAKKNQLGYYVIERFEVVEVTPLYESVTGWLIS